MKYDDILKELESMELPKSGASEFLYFEDINVVVERLKSLVNHAIERKNYKLAKIHKQNLLNILVIVKHYPENHNIKYEDWVNKKNFNKYLNIKNK